MPRRSRAHIAVLIALTGFSLLASACAAGQASAPAPAAPPVTIAALISPTGASTAVPAQAATVIPQLSPALTLKPRDFYFSVDGQPSFIFSRNVAGNQQAQYNTLLDWTKSGGSRFVRLSLDSFGMGYTSTGSVDEYWAVRWEAVFDKAEADGIYVLPIFSSWYDWNSGTGYSTWKTNPLNQAAGGPVQSPAELFQKGSATETLWMQWMQALVKRWHGRTNILAWEIFSEVNLATGSTRSSGVDFVDTAAALIRSADPGRPVTASIADCPPGSGACYWPDFYKVANIDFVEMHPYASQLDRVLVSLVRKNLGAYGRPVLIGESGLSAETPDSAAGKLTVAANASVGVRHAIWASIVSGAMNGRALWWEDGVGIYFAALGMPWMQQYQAAELPAVKFVSGVDFSGFQPLTTTSTAQVWGAAIGDDRTVLGWYRDAGSEPPNWTLRPVITKQTVTMTVPGSAMNWKVEFYSTKTGTDVVAHGNAVRAGDQITILLPDFTDDIAFKMIAQ